ncbi:MAG TPA: lysophospholipid acyltransferase family protein [Candidatus Sulfomarinibacteraceae bacterium]|nr:lysophospholipid acyltransferase family protein [Candidatus Sulfomarinibacteraceae bacterium]
MKAVDRLPRPDLPPWSRTIRYYASRLVVGLIIRVLFRVRVEGREHLPTGPAIYCFNHLNWLDPFLLYATLPLRPRLYFFGPKEEDLRVGPRNRLMYWTGTAVPYKPAKSDLLDVARRVAAVFEANGVLAIAGEGRIHVAERDLLELQDGAAYFAIRSGIPIVPVALNGTSWLGVRRRLRVRIGRPIPTGGRATTEAVAAVTAATWQDLKALLADAPDVPRPGRFGRWLTEVFNDWPEGSREASAEVRGPSGILLAGSAED